MTTTVIVNTKDFDAAAYIRRVRLLRKLHGMNQTQWSEFIGITIKKWNHYERGYPMSRETAFLLRSTITLFSFSLDWLYWGDIGCLTLGLMRQLDQLEREDRLKKPNIVPYTGPDRKRKNARAPAEARARAD